MGAKRLKHFFWDEYFQNTWGNAHYFFLIHAWCQDARKQRNQTNLNTRILKIPWGKRNKAFLLKQIQSFTFNFGSEQPYPGLILDYGKLLIIQSWYSKIVFGIYFKCAIIQLNCSTHHVPAELSNSTTNIAWTSSAEPRRQSFSSLSSFVFFGVGRFLGFENFRCFHFQIFELLKSGNVGCLSFEFVFVDFWRLESLNFWVVEKLGFLYFEKLWFLMFEQFWFWLLKILVCWSFFFQFWTLRFLALMILDFWVLKI